MEGGKAKKLTLEEGVGGEEAFKGLELSNIGNKRPWCPVVAKVPIAGQRKDEHAWGPLS